MSPLPEIGIRLSGAVPAQRCVELAKAADVAGFAAVWFAENPLQRGVLATAGACAATTERVRIGIGVVNPFTRHPAQIAMDFAALDELAEGRVILGIGSGLAASLHRLRCAGELPVTAVREAITIIRAMLTGDSAALHGRVFAVDGARLTFPARPMPIYMAAAGDPALNACGAVADGLVISNLTPSQTTVRLVRRVHAAARHAGRPAPRIVQYVPCVIGADRNAARAAAKALLQDMLTGFWPSDGVWPKARETIVAETGIPRAEFSAALRRLRGGEVAADVLDDRFVDAFSVAGTLEDCLRQAMRYRAAGVDELALTFPVPDADRAIASLGEALQ